ncbi:uncharacterized protein N7498_004859 [Penicillium cinerascens]|uniref:DJ-1/PfpI domain-containing protein n=1 Tax=Penicillium cinerascens TaxID=70096 RepID=A0A9W9MML6_9EURO|nr:uncharacterized protein N7498_004859 [Penicillium cinerascens]KAJ5203980.1 hypothetical protein N7498_004859 [Penicillium cinerascens]
MTANKPKILFVLSSHETDDAYCQEFYRTKKDLWKSTEKLASFLGRAKDFDVIFVVGGFGRRHSLSLQSLHFMF